jgi:hypothetical protein
MRTAGPAAVMIGLLIRFDRGARRSHVSLREGGFLTEGAAAADRETGAAGFRPWLLESVEDVNRMRFHEQEVRRHGEISDRSAA